MAGIQQQLVNAYAAEYRRERLEKLKQIGYWFAFIALVFFCAFAVAVSK